MVTMQVFIWVSLCALLILGTDGFPVKGLKSQDQSKSDTDTGGHSASHQGGAGIYYAPVSFGAPRDMSSSLQMVEQASSPSQFVYTDPASGSMSSMPGHPGVFMLLPVGYPSSSQTEAAQSSPPETKWSVDPKPFEEGLANTEAIGFSSSLPAPPPAPSGPVLQSGDTSSVVKEAELGNYQQKTEELGYPADRMGPAQGLAKYPLSSPFLPSVGGYGVYPGLYPYSSLYPVFDYRLLYGLYPPGAYNTFSKNYEKGKDRYQSIHYLKEHGPGPSDVPNAPGSSGHQKEIFSRAPWSA